MIVYAFNWCVLLLEIFFSIYVGVACEILVLGSLIKCKS